MSMKFGSFVRSRPFVALETQSLRNVSIKENGIVTYILLTFFVVLGIYFLTKTLKGWTRPEEVDLGSVRVVQRTTNCRNQGSRRPR